MKRIVLFFTALLLMLSYSVTYGQSKGCPGYGCALAHRNINCPEGDAWQNEKNAVVRIIDHKGDHWTGVLVNTTLGANNPHFYILTHIYLTYPGVQYDPSKWEFYWHYESWNCEAFYEPPRFTIKGGQLVARSFCNITLIELDVDPAEQWDITPYYVGWDRLNEIVTGTTQIYHPNGDIKKIHYSNATITRENGCSWSIPLWDPSPVSTNRGIGGSPFFNSDHKLLGLYHTYETCSGDPCVAKIIFSNFNGSWEGGNDPTQRLKTWLDPINTGAVKLDGRGCQKTIRLRNQHTPYTITYHATEAIISEQVIHNGRNVTYKAGDSIVLQAREKEFHAHRGSNFHAQIEDCDNPPNTSYSTQGGEYSNDNFGSPNSSLPQSQISPKINLSPNPSNGSFNIEANFPLTDIDNFKIVNLLGVPIYETQKVTSNTVQLQNLAKGTYFVVMILKDGAVLTRKMVVQ